jgi:hypothetical protein
MYARSLQRAGAVDRNICGGPAQAHTLRAAMGTLHDDATDEAVDCTVPGNTCGSAGGNTGYGDNLDCVATIQVGCILGLAAP